MPFNMGAGELVVIFLLVVLLFGAKRLPELAKSLGRSIQEFKHATKGLKDEFDLDKIDDRPRQTPPPPRASEPQNTESRQQENS
ncbi:MAG: twin-arginine translocase TatA/TatE family subunit [Calditrichia bacterium]|nr:twin-arginine translocase TatA/TatE family subunit [Calditrichota bacterium]MCB0287275.1 twin-arginine translocase TatA/TatE family subunit [Calditrichota bacterium]MCB9069002.1 twin-arginine translocase TatA/TatE family subunit [Calditrichia bacterium]